MKRKVKYELIASFEVEVDLDSAAYENFSSIEEAVDYDLEIFTDEPTIFLEIDREMDIEVTGDITSEPEDVTKQGLSKVCMIPACGCSGDLHP